MMRLSPDAIHGYSSIVVIDTNLLFTKDENEIVSCKFLEALEKFNDIYHFDFLIPTIVARELVEHRFRTVSSKISDCRKNLQYLERITGIKQSKMELDRHLRFRLSKQLLTLLEVRQICRFSPRIGAMRWKKIINLAVENTPPFSPHGEKEKGFKDAIILETLLQLSARYPKTVIYFLSDDRLFKEALTSEGGRAARIETYTSLNELSSYLKAEHDKFRANQIPQLFGSAAQAFFNIEDANSLYFKFKIPDLITEAIGKEWELLPTVGGSLNQYDTYDSLTATWRRISGYKTVVRETEYLGASQKPKIIYWRTTVTTASLWVREGGLNAEISQHIRYFELYVYWHSDFNYDGKITNANLDSIETDESATVDADSKAVPEYGLGQYSSLAGMDGISYKRFPPL